MADKHWIAAALACLEESLSPVPHETSEIDAIQVRACWGIGRHVVEFEQGGAARAEYGKRLLHKLAESLTAEFGRGFDERNLRNMRAFFQVFPIWNTVRTELSFVG